MGKYKITDTESFIKRSKELYGDLFSYDKTIYTTWRTPLLLKCNNCGNYFYVTPAKHLGTLKKRPKYGIIGCPSCNHEHGMICRRNLAANKWFKKAKEKHGDNFDYSKSSYIDNDTPIEIFCKECGEYFWQSPLDHLRSPFHQCPKCIQKRTNLEQSIGTDEFIRRSELLYGKDRFDFSKTNYKNSYTPVRILDKEKKT